MEGSSRSRAHARDASPRAAPPRDAPVENERSRSRSRSDSDSSGQIFKSLKKKDVWSALEDHHFLPLQIWMAHTKEKHKIVDSESLSSDEINQLQSLCRRENALKLKKYHTVTPTSDEIAMIGLGDKLFTSMLLDQSDLFLDHWQNLNGDITSFMVGNSDDLLRIKRKELDILDSMNPFQKNEVVFPEHGPEQWYPITGPDSEGEIQILKDAPEILINVGAIDYYKRIIKYLQGKAEEKIEEAIPEIANAVGFISVKIFSLSLKVPLFVLYHLLNGLLKNQIDNIKKVLQFLLKNKDKISFFLGSPFNITEPIKTDSDVENRDNKYRKRLILYYVFAVLKLLELLNKNPKYEELWKAFMDSPVFRHHQRKNRDMTPITLREFQRLNWENIITYGTLLFHFVYMGQGKNFMVKLGIDKEYENFMTPLEYLLQYHTKRVYKASVRIMTAPPSAHAVAVGELGKLPPVHASTDQQLKEREILEKQRILGIFAPEGSGEAGDRPASAGELLRQARSEQQDLRGRNKKKSKKKKSKQRKRRSKGKRTKMCKCKVCKCKVCKCGKKSKSKKSKSKKSKRK